MAAAGIEPAGSWAQFRQRGCVLVLAFLSPQLPSKSQSARWLSPFPLTHPGFLHDQWALKEGPDFKPCGFPDGSDGNESACNAGDQVQILGWEDPLEKGMATHSSILAWRNPWKSLAGYSPWGCKESDMTERLTLQALLWFLNVCRVLFVPLFHRSHTLHSHCLHPTHSTRSFSPQSPFCKSLLLWSTEMVTSHLRLVMSIFCFLFPFVPQRHEFREAISKMQTKCKLATWSSFPKLQVRPKWNLKKGQGCHMWMPVISLWSQRRIFTY